MHTHMHTHTYTQVACIQQNCIYKARMMTLGDLDIFRGLRMGGKIASELRREDSTPHSKSGPGGWALVSWPEGMSTGELVTLLR